MSATSGSGYRACACRDCFEIAIGTGPTLCWSCNEAGCSIDGQWACHNEEYGDDIDNDVDDTSPCMHEFRPAVADYDKCIRCGQCGPDDETQVIDHGSL
ncbi:hypothetical protein [Nocardia vulneris]|uniref:4Fe-4S ferredoxin-type domain-containing protein n=1 Tax=Nocardia vulneris TaxID=1141657 RepID=A0ABR4Z7F9_9NOCA|nr:hypothetical protein [Nocardia vulneris]KIA61253.1 hypothetical protein FG87_31930 [Nocardia vulneris]